MTPYEEMQQRQMAAAIAQATNTPISQQAASAAGMMPGMMSQSAGAPDINAARQRAAGSTKGAEAKLAQQQAYANSLRGSKMPDGREVGPSGIYVQANAGDMTKYLVDQIGGGYLASQAGKAADELDTAQTDVNLGGLELEDARTDVANQFSTDERVAGQDFAGGLQQSKLAAQAAVAAADRGSRETVAGNRLTQDYAGMKGVEYMDTSDPAGRTTINTVGSPNGRLMRDPQTGQMVPVDESRYVPMGDLVATEREGLAPGRDFTPDSIGGKVAPSSVVSRIMLSPVLEESTGALDLGQYIGGKGYGDKGNEIQDLQRDMGTVLIQGMSANLETMEAKPVSDFESRMAQIPVPGRDTQPYGWVGWSANTYRPAAKQEMDMAITETREAGNEAKAVQQEAKRDEILLQHDKDTITGAITHGYPLEKLRAAGMDPDLIDYMQYVLEQEKR